MIDWDAIVIGPAHAVFAEPVVYAPAQGAAFDITGVFDEAYREVSQLVDLGVTSTHPALGVQVSQFPAGYDPERAQGDRFTVTRTGKTYIVKAGRPDSHGAARLDAMKAP